MKVSLTEKKVLYFKEIIIFQDVVKIRLHMWQVNCNYKRDNTDTNVHYVKNQNTLQNMCWNVKKLTSSHLLQNPKRENRKDNRDLYKNKKEKEVPIIQV